MTDAEKIADYEALLRRLWDSHVDPFLNDPKYGNRFMALDRELSKRGLSGHMSPEHLRGAVNL
jgi:hypothetical protein